MASSSGISPLEVSTSLCHSLIYPAVNFAIEFVPFFLTEEVGLHVCQNWETRVFTDRGVCSVETEGRKENPQMLVKRGWALLLCVDCLAP